jgi:hypothetical protein
MNSRLGYWRDMNTTPPPCRSQLPATTCPTSGLPVPPLPVITVDVPVGQPPGRISFIRAILNT